MGSRASLPQMEPQDGDGRTAPLPAAQTLGQRLGATEAELTRLSATLRQARLEWERIDASDLQERYDTLRRAVQRYSRACAEVDLCIALIHARNDANGEAAENLRRSLEEQTVASNELRSLARLMHGTG